MVCTSGPAVQNGAEQLKTQTTKQTVGGGTQITTKQAVEQSAITGCGAPRLVSKNKK